MPRRPIRIGHLPAATDNGGNQIACLAKGGNIDAITVTYLTEPTVASQPAQLQSRSDLGCDPNFLEQLAWNNGATARLIAQNRTKIVLCGALNPRRLAEKTDAYFRSLGINDVTVAWIEGDNVTEQVRSGDFGATIRPVDRPTAELRPPPPDQVLTANAHTGQAGIVAALEAGADVVLCGRCAEASPVLGLASWWHGWDPRNHDRLAAALMAGHIIGGQQAIKGNNVDMGRLLVAEIRHDGDVVLIKAEGSRGGALTMDTCKARLLYGIQGPFHVHPDVIADTRQAKLEEMDRGRVRLSGIKGLPPPSTVRLDLGLLGGGHLPALAPQNQIPLRVCLVGRGKVIGVPAKEARDCRELLPVQPNYEPRRAASYNMVGKIFPPGTLRRPIGQLALATASGGPNGANVGFWVNDRRAWEWLCGFMTSARLKELLGPNWEEKYALERCEFPNLWAVHFAVRDTGKHDVTGRGGLERFGEHIRRMLGGRVVEMPTELVQAEMERRKTRTNTGQSRL